MMLPEDACDQNSAAMELYGEELPPVEREPGLDSDVSDWALRRVMGREIIWVYLVRVLRRKLWHCSNLLREDGVEIIVNLNRELKRLECSVNYDSSKKEGEDKRGVVLYSGV